MNRVIAIAASVSALSLTLPSARAETMGVVIEVIDGDTISVLVDGKERWVHLAEVDAPERAQKYTEASRCEHAHLIQAGRLGYCIRVTLTNSVSNAGREPWRPLAKAFSAV